jgi:hypothetical protein
VISADETHNTMVEIKVKKKVYFISERAFLRLGTIGHPHPNRACYFWIPGFKLRYIAAPIEDRSFYMIQKISHMILASLLCVTAAGCGESKSKDKEEPTDGTSTHEATQFVQQDICLDANGTWDAVEQSCDVPRPQLPALWKRFEDSFPANFQANVTGPGLRPYLLLYVIPEAGREYLCSNFNVEAGYVDGIEGKGYVSSDCALLFHSIESKSCIGQTTETRFIFSISGTGVWKDPDGSGQGIFHISEASKKHAITVEHACEQ